MIAISPTLHAHVVGVALSTITICVYVSLTLSLSFFSLSVPSHMPHAMETQSALTQATFVYVVFASADVAATVAAAAAVAAPWPVTLPRRRATHINYCISGVLKMYECSSCYPVV